MPNFKSKTHLNETILIFRAHFASKWVKVQICKTFKKIFLKNAKKGIK
jgi:hypothetical protein